MTNGRTIALTRWTLVGKVISLLLNTLSRFAIALLPRSKHLLISWLQSSSTVTLEKNRMNSVTVATFTPSICYEVVGLDVTLLIFWMLSINPAFSTLLFHPYQRFLVSLHFLPLEQYHLHIWGCWYFSQRSWLQLVIHPAWHSHDVLCTEVK